MMFSNLRRAVALAICPELSPREASAIVASAEAVAGASPIDLLTLSEAYTAFVDRRSEATVSNLITGTHARLFKRIRAGGGCGVDTYIKAITWFDENWPADLEWPADIPRPSDVKAKSRRVA